MGRGLTYFISIKGLNSLPRVVVGSCMQVFPCSKRYFWVWLAWRLPVLWMKEGTFQNEDFNFGLFKGEKCWNKWSGEHTSWQYCLSV